MHDMTNIELNQILAALHTRMDFLKEWELDIRKGLSDDSSSTPVDEALSAVVSAMHKLGASYAKR